MLHAVVTLFGQVRGMAMNLEAEGHAEQDTGMTGPEWMRTQDGQLRRVLAGSAWTWTASSSSDRPACSTGSPC